MKVSVEKNLFLLGLFAFLLFSIGAITTTIVPPLVNEEMWSAGTNVVHTYTEQELRGIEIYKREGCVYCHTQQIRNLESDQIRYGWKLVHAPVSESWEYTNDEYSFLEPNERVPICLALEESIHLNGTGLILRIRGIWENSMNLLMVNTRLLHSCLLMIF